jgi:hypothetical protein
MNQWWPADHGFIKICSRLTRPVIQTVYQILVIRIYLPIKTINSSILSNTCKDKVVTVRETHPVKVCGDVN